MAAIMTNGLPEISDAWDIAARWCSEKGEGWSLTGQLGVGGTAPVFELETPVGLRALKIYNENFSYGKMGEIEHTRIEQQLQLREHNCPSLVKVYEGGLVEDRLYLLMSRAPGTELEKRLHEVPRSKIRSIIHNVAQACLFLQQRELCHRDIKSANVFVSDDFTQATLLDISVIRDIHDPVGAGSDHDGQLPVLATARYSPPEYLFRLIEPGAQLWHALNVYQLGALLHDLIVRTPLFQAEYEHSKANRYRFAWIVATEDPYIDAPDVDHDLLFLARRALDKEWRRRSALRIEDFLNDSTRRQQHAFQMLGLHRDSVEGSTPTIQQSRLLLDEASSNLETHLIEYFRNAGVTTKHQVVVGPTGDDSRSIELTWNVEHAVGSTVAVSLRCTLHLLIENHTKRFGMTVNLSNQEHGTARTADIAAPDVRVDEHSTTSLATQAEAAIAHLATDLLHPEQQKR